MTVYAPPPTDPFSVALLKQDSTKLKELVKSKTAISENYFAALCKDYPSIALKVFKKYNRVNLPKELNKFTITSMGYKPEHEDLLIKLVEYDMCRTCPTLLHLACQCNYHRLVKILLDRKADVTATDPLTNTPREYAERNRTKYAREENAIEKEKNRQILEYLDQAEKPAL